MEEEQKWASGQWGDTREPILVPPSTKEYKMIMFSLKQALRLANSDFESLEVHRYGNRGINHEEAHEKATIECWYRPNTHQEEQDILHRQGMIITDELYQEFQAGSIVVSEQEIPVD